eukprot:1186579-Prorocentrum_minimum.AAC.3
MHVHSAASLSKRAGEGRHGNQALLSERPPARQFLAAHRDAHETFSSANTSFKCMGKRYPTRRTVKEWV